MPYLRKETIGDAVLYLGDTIKILPTLEPVDMIFTDPPYKLTSGGNSGGMSGGKFDRKAYNNNGKIVTCDIDWPDFMPLLAAIMKNPSHCYIMSNHRHLGDLIFNAKKNGIYQHNILVWDKGAGTQNRWYMSNCEYTFFGSVGKAFQLDDCGSMSCVRIPLLKNTPHPTTKPIELIKLYIKNSSKRGQTVLDSFMGSGSTGEAALLLGRKFIGIEIEEKWFDLSCRNLEAFAKKSEDEKQNDQAIKAVQLTMI